jgi:hypothetical protein
MKRLFSRFLFLSLVVALAASAAAQMEMPKPGPELKKLDYFAGTWTLEGDLKPSPMGPGGKMVETERNKWMQGRLFSCAGLRFQGRYGQRCRNFLLGLQQR